MFLEELLRIRKEQASLLEQEIELLEKELNESQDSIPQQPKAKPVIDLKKIKRLCREQGMSVSGLERELNIARGSIYKWDAHTPSCKKLKDTSEILGVGVDELYLF